MARLVTFPVRVLFFTLRIVFPCSLLLFASCTKPTIFPRYLTVSDVINNVKCELYLAIAGTRNSAWLNAWSAKFEVVLQVTRETGGNGDLTLVVPYHLGLFTIVAGGTLAKRGQSRVTFNFLADDNLKVFMSKNQCAYWQQLGSRNNLAGETGLRLWFGNLIEGVNNAQIVKQSTGFVYTIEFVTTLDGHIRPSFITSYPSGRIFSGEFAVNHGREDDNTLTVAFSPPEPAAVPFVVTGLGKALARIEAELKKERQKKADAEAKLDKLNSLQGLRALTEGEDQSFRGAQEQVRRSQKTINSLEAEKTDLQVRAAAGTAAAGKGVGATERQLDNLLLRDAIRDIPRR